MTKILVIGAGAAGLMAAGKAAELGSEVTLLEKNKRTGRKICITGKGRCNVTNNCPNNIFIENVSRNSRFLYSAINSFATADTMSFFEDLGVPLKTERGNRVFPESDRAIDIANALERYAKMNGVRIIPETVCKSLIAENGEVKGAVDTKGNVYEADSVIIATGGKSYPLTGSTGDGYKLAASVGHSVISPAASLIPLVCTGGSLKDCGDMQGLSLRNVSVSLMRDDKEVYSDFGELLFTHFGISGPTVLSASAHMEKPYTRYSLKIDLKPALSCEKLDARLLSDFDKYKNREFANSLCDLLPSSMIPVVLRRLSFVQGLRTNSVTKEQRAVLLHLLKNFTLEISDTRPIDEAIITRGGVSVKEINPATMQSKLIKGLYFCGEVIDVDAYTGGFNLQIAFSTGFLAGQSAAWSM
ncbi:MAG: NAD(P)/FAD-dependent oxidoreductase [Ruminococcus sp.]